MKKTTLKTMIQKGHISAISVLRENVNGYLYVTLLNKESEATNLYLGIKTSDTILKTYEIGDSITRDLKHADIVQCANAQGELRFKLSVGGNSDYSSSAELADIFELDEVPQDFDENLFLDEFEAKPAPVVAATKPAARQRAKATA